MAYLNGNAVPGLLTARTLSVKILGTTLGVASNLVLGPEAPLIHIGACVAHVTCQVACGKDAGLLVPADWRQGVQHAGSTVACCCWVEPRAWGNSLAALLITTVSGSCMCLVHICLEG